jgi:electron transport complex protein RnfC
MMKHLNGHKELTNHSEIVDIQAGKLVYIPLLNCSDILVKKGDYIKVGQMVAKRNDHFIVPIFASVSGTVQGIENRIHAGGGNVDHIVVENDGKFDRTQSFAPGNYEEMTRDELVTFMMNAGIIGCGGAGFPAYIKYKFAKGVDTKYMKDALTILINAVECEPYITADYKNTDAKLDLLFTGVNAFIKAAGAKDSIIAVKDTKKDLIAKLEAKAKEFTNIKIKAVPDAYPMGWERTLVFQIFGERYDKLPGELGVVVNNATTAIAFAEALTLGTGIVEKTVTFSGDALNKPVNVRVPVGVKVSEIVEQIGGYSKQDALVIAGGPMMGKAIKSDDFVITNSSNAITILEAKPINTIPCLRCGKCNDNCPAGILPVRINNAEKVGDVKLIAKLRADQCIECGMCTYVCPSKIEVTENVRKAKRLLLAATKK